MALSKCPDCGHKVSTTGYTSCPGCGKTRTGDGRWPEEVPPHDYGENWGVVAVVLFILIYFGCCSN